MNNQENHYQQKLSYELDSADLFDLLSEGKNIIIVDARKPVAYAAEHIPTAISIPHREMNQETTAHLNKEALYVTYCDGIGCNASTKGALKLTQLGFKVKELIGGIDWWKRDGYETSGISSQQGTKIECNC